MMDVRTDARHILPEIFEANRHRVHPAHVDGEIAVRVEKCLLDLIVRREPDLRVQVQAPRPEGNDPSERLGGECCANAEAEYQRSAVAYSYCIGLLVLRATWRRESPEWRGSARQPRNRSPTVKSTHRARREIPRRSKAGTWMRAVAPKLFLRSRPRPAARTCRIIPAEPTAAACMLRVAPPLA